MKKILLGVLLGSGIMFGGLVLAYPEFQPNPLFDPLPVDKESGLSLVPYTQEQKDMTMLYGKLEHLETLIRQCAK